MDHLHKTVAQFESHYINVQTHNVRAVNKRKPEYLDRDKYVSLIEFGDIVVESLVEVPNAASDDPHNI